jgi:hypothetical protein
MFQNRDPASMFNMDETMIDAQREFRVLANMGKLPLKKANKRFPHVTGVCPCSAKGYFCCFLASRQVNRQSIEI